MVVIGAHIRSNASKSAPGWKFPIPTVVDVAVRCRWGHLAADFGTM